MAYRRHSETEELNGEDRGHRAGDDQPYMVIYPQGNRRKLDIAQVWYYEKDEWDLASRQTFTYEYDAMEYMEELARENGLSSSGPVFLD